GIGPLAGLNDAQLVGVVVEVGDRDGLEGSGARFEIEGGEVIVADVCGTVQINPVGKRTVGQDVDKAVRSANLAQAKVVGDLFDVSVHEVVLEGLRGAEQCAWCLLPDLQEAGRATRKGPSQAEPKINTAQIGGADRQTTTVSPGATGVTIPHVD